MVPSISCLVFILFLVIALTHLSFFFFFNDTATTEIYTLSLHDALPISKFADAAAAEPELEPQGLRSMPYGLCVCPPRPRSEEHTSELQSHLNLVCRLLLEKKKKKKFRVDGKEVNGW